MAKANQEKKSPASSKGNPVQEARTAANKKRNLTRESQRQNRKTLRDVKVPRGSAREARRRAWAAIRERTTVVQVVPQLNDPKLIARGAPLFVDRTVKIETWKPTFAAWSKKQLNKGA